MKDILHLGVVYWNLILQLLRTNEQFKNVVHETIVIDPSDLQNIVLNSFSCYLNSKQFSGGSDVNKSLIKDVEEWLLKNTFNTCESDLDTTDCDLNICDFLLLPDKQSGIFDIQYDIEYTKMDFFYLNGASFYYGSHTDFKNEKSFIDNRILSNRDSIEDFKEEPEYLIVTGVKKIKEFLTNTVFDHFFVSARFDKTKSDDVKEIKSDTDCSNFVKDFDTAECTSLFLQLFEITAGVMILANWEQPSSGECNVFFFFYSSILNFLFLRKDRKDEYLKINAMIMIVVIFLKYK